MTLYQSHSPLYRIAVISRLTFQEAYRRKLLWIGLVLGVLFVGIFTVGFYFAYREATSDSFMQSPGVMEQFVRSLQLAGLYVVNFIVIMVTVLTVVGTISAEVQSNTVHAIAAKPIHRWEIVVGKWVGHAILIILYTIFLTTGIITSVFLISGYVPPNALAGMGILILESLTVLSATMFGSTLLSTLANGVLVFMLYGVAFVGGWIEQIGFLVESQTTKDIGILTSLLMPSEALWRYASTVMQTTGTSLLDNFSPFVAFSKPTPAFITYSIVYTLGLLLASIVAFSRRDF